MNCKPISIKDFTPAEGFVLSLQRLIKNEVIPYQYEVLRDNAEVRLFCLRIGFDCVLLRFRSLHLDLAIQQSRQSHIGSKLGKGHNAIG